MWGGVNTRTLAPDIICISFSPLLSSQSQKDFLSLPALSENHFSIVNASFFLSWTFGRLPWGHNGRMASGEHD